MIAVDLPAVPVPGLVESMIGGCMPVPVLLAERAAEQAAYRVRLSRGPQYREARERALADLARENKLLAAYDPRLMVRAGGAR